jgi:hypothetical protein
MTKNNLQAYYYYLAIHERKFLDLHSIYVILLKTLI